VQWMQLIMVQSSIEQSLAVDSRSAFQDEAQDKVIKDLMIDPPNAHAFTDWFAD